MERKCPGCLYTPNDKSNLKKHLIRFKNHSVIAINKFGLIQGHESLLGGVF